MATSYYDISIVAFIRGLKNVSALLKKGETYANENSIPLSKLLEARLAPDMGALTYQIQRISDSAKGVPVRIAGLPPVPMPDDETTFEDLYSRIKKTIDVLESVSEESMAGKEGVEVRLPAPSGELKFTATEYLLQFSIPNFYFHVSMAYALLRNQGVPVGKMDYLMGGN